MGVFIRTSDNTAMGFPWWFYLLVVLPFQVLAALVKAAAWLAVLVASVTVWAARAAHDRWAERHA